MDPITTAIIAALTAGATAGLTEAGKTAISDAYSALKRLLSAKFGEHSQAVQAVNLLETKPDAPGRQGMVQEELSNIHAEQDDALLQAAERLSNLVYTHQASAGIFTVQNNAPVYGQQVGNQNTFHQQIGSPPSSTPGA